MIIPAMVPNMIAQNDNFKVFINPSTKKLAFIAPVSVSR
jgi:hypothetical protein